MMQALTVEERGDTQRLAPLAAASPLQRLDQLIEAVERRIAAHEASMRETSLVNGSNALVAFELEKMHLLVALLREGRERLASASGAPS
jgi:hypothetical protein